MFLVDIAKFFKKVFLYNTSGGCLWQSYHGTVKPAGVPVLCFAPPRAFDFDQKVSWNVAQIILYYDLTKQFFPCLIWLVTRLLFQNLFWKNINCINFWWKTYTKRCTRNYVISRVKRISFPSTLRLARTFNFMVWSVKRKRRWKSRFWFCSAFVYFADLKTIFFTSCPYCSCKLF